MRKLKISLGKLFCLATVMLMTFNLFASTYFPIEYKTEFNKSLSEKTEKLNFFTLNDTNKSDLLFEEELLEEEESLEEDFHNFDEIGITFSLFRVLKSTQLTNNLIFNHTILTDNSVPRWLMIRHILI